MNVPEPSLGPRTCLDPLRFQELRATGRLPSPQGVALAVMRLTRREDVALTQIASTIRGDPALSARIIRSANAPSLRRRRPAVTLDDALLVIGLRSARQLTLGFSLVTRYREGACSSFDYLGFWRQCLLTALSAQALMSRVRGIAPDEAFVCGLFSQIGRLALATLYPERYDKLLKCHHHDSPHSLRYLEQREFATDHLELAAALLRDWGFPELHALAVQCHADPADPTLDEDDVTLRLARALQLACSLANFCEYEETIRHAQLSATATGAAELGLSVEVITEIALEVAHEVTDWCKLLGLSENPPKPVSTPSHSIGGSGEATILATSETVDDGVIPDAYLRILSVAVPAVLGEDFQQKLRQEGYSLSVAKNHLEGLRIALDLGPQLIIASFNPTSPEDLIFCRTLRESEFGRSIYVLLLIEPDAAGEIAQAFDAGADDALVKPIQPHELIVRLRAARRSVSQRLALFRETEDMRRLATDLALNNRHLRQVAMTDSLTGLVDRRYAYERLEQEWMLATRSGQPLACMIADIDHFGCINDACGHEVGDAVLRHVATLLHKATPAPSTVCRVGGEEFLVICPDLELSAALALAERLRKHVQTHALDSKGRLVPATISVGVAAMDKQTSSTAELIKRVDQAVYLAKQSGRNCVC